MLAVDRDPLTCAVARANAAALGLADLIEVRCADVAEVGTGGYDAVFVDPARRTGAGAGSSIRRRTRRRCPGRSARPRTARTRRVKVAPGIPHEAVPDGRGGRVDLGRRGREGGGAVVRRPAPRGRVRAAHPAAVGRHPAPGAACPTRRCGRSGRYLYEPDGAVIRAHLVAEVAEELGGGLIDPTIAYITADELRPTPYATAYEITDVLPFGLKRLKALLREREVGRLTVKKRGSAVEPEEVRRRVRPRGPELGDGLPDPGGRRAHHADRLSHTGPATAGPPARPDGGVGELGPARPSRAAPSALQGPHTATRYGVATTRSASGAPAA